MDIDEFWELIDTTREASDGSVSKQAELLIEILVKYPIDKLIAFDWFIDELMDNAYDAALWDAADIIGCGCSDDGFEDFRGWLIALGKETYEKALVDPESLVDLVDVDDDAKYGSLIYVAMRAYEQKTGDEMPPWKSKRQKLHYSELTGEHWPEKNGKDRFPILATKFGDCEERWKKWM